MTQLVTETKTTNTGALSRVDNLPRLIWPLAVVLLAGFAVAPLFHPLYFWGAHDARHSVYFLVEFDRSIQDGIIYPRWAPDFAFGYGYPIFNIYAPLVYFLGEVFHLLGFNFVDSVKIVFGLGFILSGLAMYLYVSHIFGRPAGVLAGTAYVYVPYHLVDVYVRGALAESSAFVLFPLALWALHRLVEENSAKFIAVSGISLALLILTHNGIALIYIPVLALYSFVFVLIKTRLRLRETLFALLPVAIAGLLGLGLSAIFWLPMALEYRFVRTDQWTTADYDYRSHFVYLQQLFSSVWGFGVSKPGPVDDMSFQLGVVPVILACIGVVGGIAVRRTREYPVILYFAAMSLIAVILMLPLSGIIWGVLNIATLVQFPWRLLALTSASLCILAGAAIGLQERERLNIPLVSLLIITVFSSYSYLSPQFIEPAEGPVSLGGLMRFQQSSGEMVGLTAWNQEKPKDSPLMPLYVAGKPIESKIDPAYLAPGASAQTLRHSTVLDEVLVESSDGTTLGFYTQYYPGWTAYLDGSKIDITPQGKLGLMTVEVPAGKHTVLIRFETTTPRVAGTLLSLLSMAGMAVWAGVAALRRRIPNRK